jgi:environmental stress-induced protein Ves
VNWQLARLADVTANLWRNGGGLTRELVAWPDPLDWTWRISVAEVAASGPFSRFDGVQRWFAVLEGKGVRLRLGGSEHRLTPLGAPFSFDGAAAVDCDLIEGATRDLNLMVRRDRACARMMRIEGRGEVVANASGVIAVYCVGAPVTLTWDNQSLGLAPDCLAWRRVPAGAQVVISGPAAWCMEVDG